MATRHDRAQNAPVRKTHPSPHLKILVTARREIEVPIRVPGGDIEGCKI